MKKIILLVAIALSSYCIGNAQTVNVNSYNGSSSGTYHDFNYSFDEYGYLNYTLTVHPGGFITGGGNELGIHLEDETNQTIIFAQTNMYNITGATNSQDIIMSGSIYFGLNSTPHNYYIGLGYAAYTSTESVRYEGVTEFGDVTWDSQP